jgi:hypothetical protein
LSTFSHQQTGEQHLPVPHLSPETYEALSESARRNGRTVHEEAEHIIKTHLAASGEDND